MVLFGLKASGTLIVQHLTFGPPSFTPHSKSRWTQIVSAFLSRNLDRFFSALFSSHLLPVVLWELVPLTALGDKSRGRGVVFSSSRGWSDGRVGSPHPG